MTASIRSAALAAGIAALTLAPGAAIGGGDSYDALADVEGKGPAYFGFVRDTRGRVVVGARVVLQPKTGEPVVLKSNAVGLYRSHISKEVRPDDVSVSCEMKGYKLAQVQRRQAPGSTDMHIETNCTMQRL